MMLAENSSVSEEKSASFYDLISSQVFRICAYRGLAIRGSGKEALRLAFLRQAIYPVEEASAEVLVWLVPRPNARLSDELVELASGKWSSTLRLICFVFIDDDSQRIFREESASTSSVLASDLTSKLFENSWRVAPRNVILQGEKLWNNADDSYANGFMCFCLERVFLPTFISPAPLGLLSAYGEFVSSVRDYSKVLDFDAEISHGYGAACLYDASLCHKIIALCEEEAFHLENIWKQNDAREFLQFEKRDDFLKECSSKTKNLDLIIRVADFGQANAPKLKKWREDFAKCLNLLVPGGRLCLIFAEANAVQSREFFPNKDNLLLERREVLDLPRRIEFFIFTLNPFLETYAKFEQKLFPQKKSNYASKQVVNFGKNYERAHLVPSLVVMGARVADGELLAKLARQTLTKCSPASADVGAALCVLGYQHLRHLNSRANARECVEMALAIEEYFVALKACSSLNPHQKRWRISLLYVLGLLHSEKGDLDLAYKNFCACACADFLEFSPLLATKSVAASWRAGMIKFCSGDLTTARKHWQEGVTTSERAVKADWREVIGEHSTPLTFGLRELSEVLRLASFCAAALTVMSSEATVRRASIYWQLRNEALEKKALSEIRETSLQNQMNQMNIEMNIEMNKMTEKIIELERRLFWQTTRANFLGQTASSLAAESLK